MGRMDQGKILLTRRQLERKIQETLEMTSFPVIFLFFLSVADLVDGQRRARAKFAGQTQLLLLLFGLVSDRENERRRRRKSRRNEIKRKFDNGARPQFEDRFPL